MPGKQRVLICWLGANDLNAVSNDRNEIGSILLTLQAESFDRLELLCAYLKDTVAPYLD